MDHSAIAANIQRIRSARKLSQGAVAEGSGLSRGAYRKIELGEAEPRVRTLEAIAVALGVPVRELLAPAVELRNVRFRAEKTLRTRGQILADVGRWLADYNSLEALLAKRRTFKLGGVAARLAVGPSDPCAAARLARETLGLSPDEPIRDICGLLESAGVKVFPMVVASDGFFGLSAGPSDGGPAVAVNTWERISVERWIFSTAHELGHLLLHLGDYEREQESEAPDHEREADAFASEFLMPDAAFRREWAEAYGLPFVARVIKVKRIFRVSYRTVLHRQERSYDGWGNIWVRFQTDYKALTQQALSRRDEPEGLRDGEFRSAAPETLRGREPEHLSPSDFCEDRLAGLVRSAIEAGEISLGRGAEILGLPVKDMRARASSWVS